MNDWEAKAKAKWNAEADQFNQWSELDQDEKDDLIEKTRKAGLASTSASAGQSKDQG